MKILVTGATGMAGAEVIRQAIADQTIEKITALVRKPLLLQDARLKTVIHSNFLDYADCVALFREHDVCICCLGISQTQVSKQEYHTITYDYVVEAAKAMVSANPSIGFIFISGDGADSTEKSKTLFARVKGKAENALLKLPFKKLIIARPGGIQPIHKNPNSPFLYKLFIPLLPVLKLFAPSSFITSVQLARVLLYVAKNGSDKQILENTDLLQIFKEHCNQ